jgi:hypothetical protein
MSDVQEKDAVNMPHSNGPSAKDWLEKNLEALHQQEGLLQAKIGYCEKALKQIESHPEMDDILKAIFLS